MTARVSNKGGAMKYLFDIGNSRVKWARVNDAGVQSRGVFAAADLHDFFDKSHPKIDAVSIAEVSGGDVAQKICEWSESELNAQPVLARVQREFAGVEVAYPRLNKLGVDRWLAMLGAWSRVKSACIVIDGGSALTVDYINDEGKHLGGFIVPGVDMMRQALFDRTHAVKIPEMTLRPDWQLGSDTMPCVENGISAMLLGFIREVLNIERAYRSVVSPAVLVSGGDAEVIASVVQFVKSENPVKVFPLKHIEVCPDLVFEGLMCVS